MELVLLKELSKMELGGQLRSVIYTSQLVWNLTFDLIVIQNSCQKLKVLTGLLP